VSTQEFFCSDCEMVVDDRGCPRCWWKTPVPKLRKRVKMTSANMGGGPPPRGVPSIALAGSGDFTDITQSTRTLVISGVTCPAGGSLLIGVTFALAQLDALFSMEWNGITYLRTDSSVKRREEYDDAQLCFLQSWLITRPGSGTHNLTINFDPFSQAPSTAAAIVVAIGGGPSSGDPMDRPDIGNITTLVSHCTSTTFLQLNTNPAGPAYPYTTTSSPAGNLPNEFGPDRCVAFLAINGPSANLTGDWSTGLTRLTKAGTGTPISDNQQCAIDCATFVLPGPGATFIQRTGLFTPMAAVISLDTFRP
jgi:hypothetical protein